MEKGFDMGFYEVLSEVGKRVNVPMSSIGPLIGRNPSYVSSAMGRGSDPSTANAAAMLGACGWSLVAVPSDDVPPSALAIEPPEPDQDAERRTLERRRDKLRRELAATEQLLG